MESDVMIQLERKELEDISSKLDKWEDLSLSLIPTDELEKLLTESRKYVVLNNELMPIMVGHYNQIIVDLSTRYLEGRARFLVQESEWKDKEEGYLATIATLEAHLEQSQEDLVEALRTKINNSNIDSGPDFVDGGTLFTDEPPSEPPV